MNLSAQLLDDRPDRPGFRDDLDFALATIRGLALLRIASGENSRAVTHRWHVARERLTRILS